MRRHKTLNLLEHQMWAPHPSVRSGRSNFIILTPPRNSSHPTFFVCVTECQRRHARVAPSVRRRNGKHPCPPHCQSERGRAWNGTLLCTDDMKPTGPQSFWPKQTFSSPLVSFLLFLPNLSYCHFGSDKNVSHKLFALYMFAIAAFFPISGKKTSSDIKQD